VTFKQTCRLDPTSAGSQHREAVSEDRREQPDEGRNRDMGGQGPKHRILSSVPMELGMYLLFTSPEALNP